MTLLLISFLALRNKPTLVEMKVTAQGTSFVALPPVQAEGDEKKLAADAPAMARKISLFPPLLAVEAMEVKDVDCVETTLDGVGPVALQTAPGGSIGISGESPETEEPKTVKLLRPELVLNEPTSLAFEVAGRDKVTIWLEHSRLTQSPPSEQPVSASSGQAPPCAEPVVQDRGWNGFVPTQPALSLRLRDVQRAGPTEAAFADSSLAETGRVSRDAARFRVTGGRRDSQLSLALPHPAGPSAVLRMLNPATGEISGPTSLPIALSESRFIPWQDRLVLLDPEPSAVRPVPLLRPDLKVRELELARRVQLEARSFIVEGEVRFPAGEKESIKLEPGSFVSLATEDGQPLTLRSLELSSQGFELLLWGEPSSLRIGPTPELLAERLPSYFEWLVRHQLSGLIYGTLGYVLALSLTAFKLLGWVKG
jgi:hypothetical protein